MKGINLFKSLNNLGRLISGRELKKKMIIKYINIIILTKKTENLDGFIESEKFALSLILQGKAEKADSITKITRNMPVEANDILKILLILNSPIIIDEKKSFVKPKKAIVPRYDSSMTFESFIHERFFDIKATDILILNTNDTFNLLQGILTGISTDYTEIINHKIRMKCKIRFEEHTFKSTEELLKRYIDVGNNRLKVITFLRNDTFSYEIRRHLTKFDAYVSTLSNNSPLSIITKIRPFSQVFEWFIKLISAETFSKVHNVLLQTSQTAFKLDFSITLWKAAFEEAARPLYKYAFSAENIRTPDFSTVFTEIKRSVLFSGEFIRFLRDIAPSHPLFDVAEEFIEVFLNLENRVDEYKERIERVIISNEQAWNEYHEEKKKAKRKQFELKRDILNAEIKKQKIKIMESREKNAKNKRIRLMELKKQAEEEAAMRKEQKMHEEEEKRKYIESLVSSKVANPLMRPLTEEERVLVELEKIDMFKEFQKQMRELGATEENIMKFFPELNLPNDEYEALQVQEIEQEEYNRNSRLESSSSVKSSGESSHIKIEEIDNDFGVIQIDDLNEEIAELEHLDIVFESNVEIEDITRLTSPPKKKSISINMYNQMDTSKSPNYERKHDTFLKNVETSEESLSFIPGTPLQSIPAIFHRLVVPSFKIHHELVSKAIFSLLKTRDLFKQQLIALQKLFLIKPSFEANQIHDLFGLIPYNEQTFANICSLFKQCGKIFGFRGDVSISLTPKLPNDIDQIFSLILNMEITIKPEALFDRLLPPYILTIYIQVFKFVTILRLAKSAITKMWMRARDSYYNKPDSYSCSFMSRFVVNAETYIYDTALTQASKALLTTVDCSTVEDYLSKHKKIAEKMEHSLFLTKEMYPIKESIINVFKEIVRFAYGRKKTDMSIFSENAKDFANTVNSLNNACHGQNQNYFFLDLMFTDFAEKL